VQGRQQQRQQSWRQFLCLLMQGCLCHHPQHHRLGWEWQQQLMLPLLMPEQQQQQQKELCRRLVQHLLRLHLHLEQQWLMMLVWHQQLQEVPSGHR
jgi:uncharacterized membrane protein